MVVAGLHKEEGTDGKPSVVVCARQTKIEPDLWLESAEVQERKWDALVLVGGLGGAQAFAASEVITNMIKNQLHHERIVASMCASPALVLAPLGVLADIKATCFPFMLDKIPLPSQDNVVRSGNIWTSQGPGTAIEFALALSNELVGHAATKKVAAGMLVPCPEPL